MFLYSSLAHTYCHHSSLLCSVPCGSPLILDHFCFTQLHSVPLAAPVALSFFYLPVMAMYVNMCCSHIQIPFPPSLFAIAPHILQQLSFCFVTPVSCAASSCFLSFCLSSIVSYALDVCCMHLLILLSSLFGSRCFVQLF